MNIAFLGLGRMGSPLCAVLNPEHSVVAFDTSPKARAQAEINGIAVAASLASMVERVPSLPSEPRVIWCMIPAAQMRQALDELLPLLNAGDILVDGGNSAFQQSKSAHRQCRQFSVIFVSLGCSGGIEGAQSGPPMTLSCDLDTFNMIKPILVSLGDRYTRFDSIGFGHLAKSIHNAIEYGMMQSIAEGVALYFKYGFNQQEILDTFRTWSKGSIIESKLLDCVIQCLENHDYASARTIKKSETVEALEAVCDVGVATPCIDAAIRVRKDASTADTIALTTLALMRKNFGGHAVDGPDKISVPRK